MGIKDIRREGVKWIQWFRVENSEGFYEHGDELSGSIKYTELLD
jgi:hypothetical protein